MGSGREHEATLADVNGAIGTGPLEHTIKPEFMEPEDILSGEAMITIETIQSGIAPDHNCAIRRITAHQTRLVIPDRQFQEVLLMTR